MRFRIADPKRTWRRLEPIASPCHFQRFQALAFPIANSQCRMVRSPSPRSPVASRWGQDLGGAIAGGVITYTANGTQKVAVAAGFTTLAWPTKIVKAKIVALGLEGMQQNNDWSIELAARAQQQEVAIMRRFSNCPLRAT